MLRIVAGYNACWRCVINNFRAIHEEHLQTYLRVSVQMEPHSLPNRGEYFDPPFR